LLAFAFHPFKCIDAHCKRERPSLKPTVSRINLVTLAVNLGRSLTSLRLESA
jgi:hypothetical protein